MIRSSGSRFVALVVVLLLCAYADGGQSAGQAPAIPGAKTPGDQKPQPQPPPRTDPKDILDGGDQDDTLTGTDADNWLFGKKGADFLRGGKGRDVVDAGDGDDTIDGGPEGDVIDAGAGNDTVRGAEGDDTIDGGDNDDLLDGGPGNDDIDGGDDNDTLRGAAGDDVLAGGDGDDNLSGGAGADRLSGNDGADNLSGGADADRLSGGDGDDVLAGEAGDDHLDGGGGNDVVRGGPGNDTLLGSSGADTLDGGDEHDIVLGGDGRDAVNGNSGDDLLLGGTGADVVSGGDGNDLLVLRAGDVPANEIEGVDGEGGTDRLVLNGFSTSVAPQADALSDPLTGGIYRLRNIERIEHTHVFTHVGTDSRLSPSLVLVNPSSTTASSGRVVFSGDDGTLLLAPEGTTPQPRDEVAFTIPPRGTIAIAPPAQGVASASAQVFATMPLAGIAGTTLPALGPVAGLAEARLVDSAIVPVLEQSATATSTGIVVVNGPVRSNVKLTLHAAGGQELTTGSAEIDLPPYGRRTVLVRDFFPTLGDFQGTMTVEGGIDRPQEGGPIAVTVVHRVDSSGLTTHPAIQVSPSQASRALRFPAFPSGGDAVSSITLVNPSRSDRARGTLSFFDESGSPRPIALGARAAAVSVPYDLAPYGSVVFTTSAGGPARSGSARAEAAEGIVGGILRVTTPTTGTLDSGPSEEATGVIAPVRRDGAAGVTTQVTVGSTGTAATLQLTLRDAGGATVAGATATVRVPANGQVTRTLDELFPSTGTAPLQGTIAVTADAAVVARVILLSGSAPRATLMPVVPLR